jgi:hypothetical protein
MDETTIKTNLGIILQAVLAKAIEQAGFTSIQDHQYDPTCERPDFLIPNQNKPHYMIEVHQTEARNSFQMKTLRAFTAVTESKAFYGDNLVTVNVLFGDPENELPASNVRAMCGVFDVNLVPRKDAADKVAVIKMEKTALVLASDEDFKNKTAKAAEEVIGQHGKAVAALAVMMTTALSGAKARKEMFPLWQFERAREAGLGKPPVAGMPTYYKRQMLRAMFVEDADFDIMASSEPNNWPAPVIQQLVRVKLGEIKEEMDGDHFEVNPEFLKFVQDDKSAGIRRLCKATLDSVPQMRWFFEDIRSAERRRHMAEHFFELLDSDVDLADEVMASLSSTEYGGIEHRRCWVVDCVARYLGVSHNRMNNALRDIGADIEGLGNPFNQLSYKSARFMSKPDTHIKYAEGVRDACLQIKVSDEANLAADPRVLATRLLALRLDGANKLRKLDPLYLVIGEICAEYGIELGELSVQTIVSDLAKSTTVARFVLGSLSRDGKLVLLNAVAVHDSHGDDKSKEWGARRLATIYRSTKLVIKNSEYQNGVFVLDGEWEDKDVARLYRSGWNHICRLGDLEDTLNKLFGLKGKAKGAKAKNPVLVMEEGAEHA